MAPTNEWTVDDVAEFLREKGFETKYLQSFKDNEVDGETLLQLSEHMIAQLLPVIRLQVKLTNLLTDLKNEPAVDLPSVVDSPTVSASKSVHRASLSISYKLPHFPDKLQHPLASRDEQQFRVGSKTRSMIIDCIYDDLVSTGILYPSRIEYDNITSALIMEYPFLRDFDGSSNSWRFALRRKLKRCRQPLVQEGQVAEIRAKFGRPGVSGRKRKIDVEDSPSIQKVKRAKVQSVQDVVGEDARSIAKHVSTMKDEMRKRDPNQSLLRDAMKRSASYRQQYCHEHSTADVLTEFPALKLRVLFVADAKLLYDLDVSLVGQGLLALKSKLQPEAARRHKRYADVVNRYQRCFENTLSKEIQQDLDIRLCAMLLPSIFGEDDAFIYQPNGKVKGPTPCITGEDEYQITIDGIDNIFMSPIKSFQLAIEAWVATFWIFSIQFPERVKNTACLIEKVWLKKGGKVSAVVRKWGNRLKL